MGSTLKPQELKALRVIRNSLVHHGRGPSVRELAAELGYRSPRSSALILSGLIKKGLIRRRENGELQILREADGLPPGERTIEVPLVGTAACGRPMLAEENIECSIPVSVRLARPGHRHFLLRARGDSMDNAGIKDGDLVLVRQQPTAGDGEIVVALVDDEATIKELRRAEGAVVLRPRSTNPTHRPIVVDHDFKVQGTVIRVLRCGQEFVDLK